MARLSTNGYGKSHIRLTKVTRLPDRHELKELSVDVELRGDFDQTYLTGDNSKVVATDSMKNTVYVLAKKHPINSIESFAGELVWHFVNTYPQVSLANVRVEQRTWHRIETHDGPHPHAFVSGSNERRTCNVNHAAGELMYHLGIEDLVVLKTTDSAFTGYVRDEYTTLPETSDRIFGTCMKGQWCYEPENPRQIDWNKRFFEVRQKLLDVFAHHKSLSVQQSLYTMGEQVLEACKYVRSIHLEMPNQHRVPFNFAPFGMKFENDIFVPTDEPHGLIHGTISRE